MARLGRIVAGSAAAVVALVAGSALLVQVSPAARSALHDVQHRAFAHFLSAFVTRSVGGDRWGRKR
jgi:hypothetical protein